MYSQLIAVFIILGVFAVLHIVSFILIINILKSRKNSRIHGGSENKTELNDIEGVGVVFCKKCKIGFDSKYNVCPKCGSPR